MELHHPARLIPELILARALSSCARCDLVSGRTVTCVQITTQNPLRRVHITERQGTSPEVCNFQLSKTCSFRLTLPPMRLHCA